jgi:folate-dependent phosphoribosylglycinamide formyltransferase PurN
MAMKIGIVSRFPLAEATLWKQQLIDGLMHDGHDVFVVFGKRSPLDHAKEALRRASSHKGSRDVRLLAPAKLGKVINTFLPAGSASGVGTGEKTDRMHAPQPNGAATPVPKTGRLVAFARTRKLAVARFSSVNDAAALAFVRDQKPDLLVLAGAEIVRPPLLSIPHLGTLNPHYGPLPGFRGMSAQEWCLYKEVPPAVTIHFVTSGIDTGDIVSMSPLPLSPADTWTDVRRHCQDVARDALLSAVGAIASESITQTPQSAADGKQYFSMHPRLMLRAKKNLESGYWLHSPTEGSDV